MKICSFHKIVQCSPVKSNEISEQQIASILQISAISQNERNFALRFVLAPARNLNDGGRKWSRFV
jgi:hypothetical protein